MVGKEPCPLGLCPSEDWQVGQTGPGVGDSSGAQRGRAQVDLRTLVIHLVGSSCKSCRLAVAQGRQGSMWHGDTAVPSVAERWEGEMSGSIAPKGFKHRDLQFHPVDLLMRVNTYAATQKLVHMALMSQRPELTNGTRLWSLHAAAYQPQRAVRGSCKLQCRGALDSILSDLAKMEGCIQ